MRLHVLAFMFVSLPLAGVLATAQSAAPPRAAAAAIVVDAMDRTIDPCTNFYAFACGGWLAHNPVPADRQRWGRFQQVQDRNYSVLRRILETKNGDADRRKASDYYAACMAEPGIDAKGVIPLQPDLTQIDELKSRDELPELVARLHALGVNVLFRFRADTDRRNASTQIADVDQGGLSLPDRDYYLKTDARSVELRDKYAAHVQQMLGLLRSGPGRAAEAAAVTAFERTLAEAALDRVERRDPAATDHQMHLEQLQALTPGFDQRAIAFERRRNLAKIGRPVDRGEWDMTPPTVKAYYSPERNNINFPAGILQPPFYLAGRDAALNYGAAGAVIGHELTHGFDDEGRHYDGQGNLREWWTEADGKAFEARASSIADQYSEYAVAGDAKINGRLTLGENVADNGGLRLALLAYLAGPGATEKP